MTDPIPSEEFSIESEIQNITQEQDIEQVYAKTMEILENRESIIPEGKEDTVIPAVKTYFDWEQYTESRAQEVISNHSNPNVVPTEELDREYEKTMEYIQNVAKMLQKTQEIFPTDLHTKLGMNDRDIQQILSKGENLYDMGMIFLKFYRNRENR